MSKLPYGLTSDDLLLIDYKLARQKDFLERFELDGLDKSLLDMSYSANINPKKYFAEVNNRVNTLFNNAKDRGLKPVFITITAPSALHPTGKDRIYDIKTKKQVFDFDGTGVFKEVTPSRIAKYLSKLWKRFLSLKVFKHIKDSTGFNMMYLRVYEPHKSGVPHLHGMLFIPHGYILKVKKTFIEHFKNRYNIKRIQFRYTWYNQAGGAVAYILKYINKTFKHAKDDCMTLEAYYFVKHRIIRFLTSRSLVPLWIYRKINYHDRLQDMSFSTRKWKDGSLKHFFNKEMISYFYFDDGDQVEDVVYWKDPNIIFEVYKKSFEPIPSKWINRVSNKVIPIFVDGVRTHSYRSDGSLVPYRMHLVAYTDSELLSEYYNFASFDYPYDRFKEISRLLNDRGYSVECDLF